MSKNNLGTAYGISKRKKYAKGGQVPPSAKTESRPTPEAKGQSEVARNDHKKAEGPPSFQSEKRPMPKKGMQTTPIKHPTMKQSPVFKTKLRDQEDDLQESASTNEGPQEQPPEQYNEEEATRKGPETPSLHMKMMAEGGEVDGGAEMEMDHHDSIAAAIMTRRDRLKAEIDSGAHDLDEAVRMAEGGMVDIDSNAEEQGNGYYARNQAILKENYDSDLDDVSQPEDSNEHGHEIDSDKHDMIDSIRKKVAAKRQFKAR